MTQLPSLSWGSDTLKCKYERDDSHRVKEVHRLTDLITTVKVSCNQVTRHQSDLEGVDRPVEVLPTFYCTKSCLGWDDYLVDEFHKQDGTKDKKLLPEDPFISQCNSSGKLFVNNSYNPYDLLYPSYSQIGTTLTKSRDHSIYLSCQWVYLRILISPHLSVWLWRLCDSLDTVYVPQGPLNYSPIRLDI